MYLSRELEAVQKRAMRIIFPCFPFEEALVKAGLVTLSGRRQVLTDKLFKNILENKDSKLRNLLPPTKYQVLQPQEVTQVQPGFQTERFRKSFIVLI